MIFDCSAKSPKSCLLDKSVSRRKWKINLRFWLMWEALSCFRTYSILIMLKDFIGLQALLTPVRTTKARFEGFLRALICKVHFMLISFIQSAMHALSVVRFPSPLRRAAIWEMRFPETCDRFLSINIYAIVGIRMEKKPQKIKLTER